MARIKINKIRINDTYKKMYHVEKSGNYYEYLNVKFFSNFSNVSFCHFLYGDNENKNSYLLPNTKNVFSSKLAALQEVRRILIKSADDITELIKIEKKTTNG